jgi:hypothetical protein
MGKRNMRTKYLCLIAAAAMLAGAPARATVIDFELPSKYAGPTYSQDGYTLSNDSGYTTAFVNLLLYGAPAVEAYNANGPTNATIAINTTSNRTNTLTKDDGGAFDFASIALADYSNMERGDAQGGKATFTFNFAGGGSTTQIVTIDSSPGLETFVFNKTGLSSVSFRVLSLAEGGPSPNAMQFDFIDVQATAPVPEPASWAMMIGGLGLAGGALRRRARTRASIAPRAA